MPTARSAGERHDPLDGEAEPDTDRGVRGKTAVAQLRRAEGAISEPEQSVSVLVEFAVPKPGTKKDRKMAKSYKGVIRQYREAPSRIRDYFPNFAELVESYDWEISISYVFSRVELAKRNTINCGIVKLHWCDAELTRKLINEDHMSRGRFLELFKVVFGCHIPKDITEKLENGEQVRDKVMHGMKWEQADARQGLVSVIDFAKDFNDFVDGNAGFRPFGDLRGFKGRGEPLTKATTRWVLKGMGIPKREQN